MSYRLKGALTRFNGHADDENDDNDDDDDYDDND